MFTMHLYSLGAVLFVLSYGESAEGTDDTYNESLAKTQTSPSCPTAKCGKNCCNSHQVCTHVTVGNTVEDNCVESPCTTHKCEHGLQCIVKYFNPATPYAKCVCPTPMCGDTCCKYFQVCKDVPGEKTVTPTCVVSPCSFRRCENGDQCRVKYINPSAPYSECYCPTPRCGETCCASHQVCQDIPNGKSTIHNCIESPCTFRQCEHGDQCRVKLLKPSTLYTECYCPRQRCGINCCSDHEVCIDVHVGKTVEHNCIESPCTYITCPPGKRCRVKYFNPAKPYADCE